MKKFKYTYLDEETGKRKSTTIMAEDIESAERLLGGLMVIKINEARELFGGRSGNPAKYYKYYGSLMHRFSFMLSASLGIVDVIDLVIREYAKVPAMVQAFKTIRERITAGMTLSAAFSEFPQIFDIMVVSTIAIGEETGQLDKMFDKLAGFYDKKHKLNKTIKKSMMQPMITLGVMIVAFIFVVQVILPKLLSVFAEVGADLPPATVAMLALSDFLNKYILLLAAGGFFLVQFVKKLLKNPQIKYKVDKTLSKLPVIGAYQKNINLAIVTSNLSVLLESGVDLQQALTLIIEITKNSYFKEMITNAKEKIELGTAMSLAFAEEPKLFDEVFVAVLSVGENTGQLDHVLFQLSEEYFDIVDNMANVVTQAINLIVMLIMTVIVGVLVMAIYGPIQGLSDGLMNM